MNTPIHPSEFVQTFEHGINSARLEMLDCFFALEVAVGLWAKELGHRDTAAPFSQRIQALSMDTGLSARAKPGQLKHLQALPATCKNFIRIRNAMAHSRWSEGFCNGEPVAFFETLAHALAEEGAVIPIRLCEIQDAARDARRLAAQLQGFLKQNKDPTVV